MRRLPLAAALASAALLLPAASPAEEKGWIEPGEWEQTMTITSPGVPGGAAKQTIRQCFTSADVSAYGDKERWAKELGAANNPHTKCEPARVEQDGTAMVVTLECQGDARMVMRHDFRGTTGTIDTETFVGGHPMAKSHVESRRVASACSAETIARWKQQNPGKPFAP